MNSRIQDLVLREIAKHVNTCRRDYRPSARLRDDLGLDSLDEMQLLNSLEDLFQIFLREDDVRGFQTVEDVLRCVERYVDPAHQFEAALPV